jgi:hypothetical protein
MPGALSRFVTTSAEVTLVDADVRDVQLRVQPQALISANVMPDAGITRTFELGQVQLSILRRVGNGPNSWMNGAGLVASRRDGGRALAVDLPVPIGPVFFSVDAPSGWMVKAIRLDGREVEDGPVELASGRHEVEVVLTDRVSGVSGIVVDRRGRPMPNHSVIVFPPDPARWQSVSRAIRQERTDNDGRFRVEPLPPGTYRAVAVPALGRWAIEYAEVLERLQSSSEEIRIGEGQSLAVSIRASALPDGLAP